ILYRFNRCEGSLHEPLYDEVPMVQDSAISTGGVVFSSDSRMLYLVTNLWIDQYDLWADDIIGSKMRVATWDGTLIPPTNVPGAFYLPQLGPDGKIYISCINTVPYLHVIENPNERGFACNVNQLGFVLPARNGLLIPYFPNYRLGALGPGGCDSLLTGVREIRPQVNKPAFSVYPNPGNGRIQLQFTKLPLVGDVIIVKNIYGQELLRQAASTYIIDAILLQKGVYYLEYWQENKLVSTIKFIRS
ncbi:MAG: T9SS type A sorting domain-containing protein, partial [Bacteroidota bacterium]